MNTLCKTMIWFQIAMLGMDALYFASQCMWSNCISHVLAVPVLWMVMGESKKERQWRMK